MRSTVKKESLAAALEKAELTADEARLVNALGHGAENGHAQREITALTGFDPRQTREITEQCRLKGVVICADNNGRYLPDTLPELRGYIMRRRRGIKSENTALKSAEKMLEEWENERCH